MGQGTRAGGGGWPGRGECGQHPRPGRKETKMETASGHPSHRDTQQLLGPSLWVGELGSRCTLCGLTQSAGGLAGKGARGCVHKHRAWAPLLLYQRLWGRSGQDTCRSMGKHWFVSFPFLLYSSLKRCAELTCWIMRESSGPVTSANPPHGNKSVSDQQGRPAKTSLNY